MKIISCLRRPRKSILFSFLLVTASVGTLLPRTSRAEELTSAEGAAGLKINRGRVSLRSTTKREKVGSVPRRVGESEIETENTGIVALQRYDEKAACRLRLVNPRTNTEVELACKSAWILIPRKRDVIWIVGKDFNEGFVDHGRQAPYAGIHLYDFNGRLIQSLSKAQIGHIDYVRELDSEAIIVLNHIGKEYRLITLGVDGQISASIPMPAAKYEELEVLQDGKYFSIRSFQWEGRKRKASLLDTRGAEIFARTTPSNEYPRIVGVAGDGGHIALERHGASGNLVDVFNRANKERPIKTFRLPLQSREVIMSSDLDRISARSSPRLIGGVQKYSFALVEGSGDTVAISECEHEDWRRESRMEFDGSLARWLCGEQWISLEVKGAK